MIYYGVYHCKWYINNNEDGSLAPIYNCIFWTEILELNMDGNTGKTVPVSPKKVPKFLADNQDYVWLQKMVSIVYHRLSGPFFCHYMESQKD